MSITINKGPDDKVLELGCGDNPHPSSTTRVDVRPGAHVHFTADFDLPFTAEHNQAISSDEFACVLSIYAIEHVTWRSTRQFVGECFRVCKPGGKAVIVAPNTEAQLKWVQNHPEGWDGKPLFESASCKLYGDQNYSDNSHKSYWSPAIAAELFAEAGFENVIVLPHGARDTDMVIEATKPVSSKSPEPPRVEEMPKPPQDMDYASARAQLKGLPREQLFAKDYFNGGKKHGGYANSGYCDFPVHEITSRYILMRRPESVLEIGCARGYVLKRLEDAGVRVHGLDVSKHCRLTRACEPVLVWDVCKTEWPLPANQTWDFGFSQALLEHVPEELLPGVLGELKRITKRGLHGVNFDAGDGFDRTRCTIKPKEWWLELFDRHGLGGHEILSAQELEAGPLPVDYVKGDGKVKLNVGSYTLQFHNGWTNIDVHDLAGFAQFYGYNYLRHDVTKGLPFPTGGVDLIFASHFLEHLSYEDGLHFLRECRRVLKPSGALRLLVPDAGLLTRMYHQRGATIPDLSDFHEVNDGCENAPTHAAKLHAMLWEGHAAAYDAETLAYYLGEAYFEPLQQTFRQGHKQILRETIDSFPAHSLVMEATPRVS